MQALALNGRHSAHVSNQYLSPLYHPVKAVILPTNNNTTAVGRYRPGPVRHHPWPDSALIPKPLSVTVTWWSHFLIRGSFFRFPFTGSSIERLCDIAATDPTVGYSPRPNPIDDRGPMIRAARTLLSSVTRVLLLADIVVVKQLLLAKDRVSSGVRMRSSYYIRSALRRHLTWKWYL